MCVLAKTRPGVWSALILLHGVACVHGLRKKNKKIRLFLDEKKKQAFLMDCRLDRGRNCQH